MQKKLTKSNDKCIAGVCSGIAEYLDLDPTLVRLGYAFLTFFTAFFPGILFYIVMAIVIPNKY